MPKQRDSIPGRFFGVLAAPLAYTALLYMLLTVVTGIDYLRQAWRIRRDSIAGKQGPVA